MIMINIFRIKLKDMKNIFLFGIILSLLLQSTPMKASTKKPTGFKSFLQWCQQRDSIPKSAKHTVNALLKEFESNNCQVADRKIKRASIIELTNKQITDLSPLSNLPNLRHLVLDNNRITDITPLSTLPELGILTLDKNQITDITPLSTLTRLTYISLSNNQIRNIKPLANLTRLFSIHLKNNKITDLSPLSNSTKLRSLFLTNNQISDLKPLANLPRLFRLEVSGNQVTEKDCPIPKKYCNFDVKNQWN
jgi:internalin A